MNNLHKPAPNEYPANFETYLKRLPETDILALLHNQAEALLQLFENLEEAETDKGYAEGKWSLKELLQHMLDTERIMAYRALCFARYEQAMLPGFNEDNYAAESGANFRKLADILADYRLQRQSTIALFKSFNPEMVERFGQANNATYNVRSLVWVIAAHENHHMYIIKTRYLMQETAL